MNPYIRRFAVFLCLSMGLALALGPYTGKRFVEQTVNAVFMSAAGLTPDTCRAACLEKPIEINEKDLRAFPEIQKALASPALSELKSNQVSIYGGNLNGFAKKFKKEDNTSLCFVLKGKTYAIMRTLLHDMGWIILVGLDSAPHTITKTTLSDLRPFPDLRSYLESLRNALKSAEMLQQEISEKDQSPLEKKKRAVSADRKIEKTIEDIEARFREIDRKAKRQLGLLKAQRWITLYKEKRRDIPDDQWKELSRRVGGYHVRLSFVCDDFLILARRESVTESVSVDPLWFGPIKYTLAAGFLLSGFILMRRLYRSRPGIRVNPIWSAALGDSIIILFLGIGAFCVVDYILVRFIEMRSIVPEPVFRGMCAVGYLPVTLFFAFFASHLGDQSLEIELEGLKIHYPGSTLFLAWETITGFDLRQTHVVVGRGGFLMPRKLQTKLIIETGETEHSLVEPGVRRKKQRIIAELKSLAPKHLHSDLERVRQSW